jgi:hypothetical protein
MEAACSSRSGSGGFGMFLAVIIVIVLAVVGLAVASTAASQTVEALDLTRAGHDEMVYGEAIIAALPNIEVTGTHADTKHPEAAYVRKTCRERGVYQVYREKIDPTTFHLLCMDADGKLVDWIIRVVGKKVVELTAFMPRAGVMLEVIKYAASKGTRYTKGF